MVFQPPKTIPDDEHPQHPTNNISTNGQFNVGQIVVNGNSNIPPIMTNVLTPQQQHQHQSSTTSNQQHQQQQELFAQYQQQLFAQWLSLQQQQQQPLQQGVLPNNNINHAQVQMGSIHPSMMIGLGNQPPPLQEHHQQVVMNFPNNVDGGRHNQLPLSSPNHGGSTMSLSQSLNMNLFPQSYTTTATIEQDQQQQDIRLSTPRSFSPLDSNLSSTGSDSYSIPTSERSNKSKHSSDGVANAICVLFHPNGQHLNVLHQMKLAFPELIGCIYNEGKIISKLTGSKKKRFFFLNLTKPGLVDPLKKACSSIRIENEPIQLDDKGANGKEKKNDKKTNGKEKKSEPNQEQSQTPIPLQQLHPQSQPITISIKLTPIQALVMKRFFMNELSTEMQRLCGKNSFFPQEDSVLFVVEPIQPGISNIPQYLQTQLFNLLQRVRFAEFFGETSQAKKKLIETKLPDCVFHTVESKEMAGYGTWYLSSLSDSILTSSPFVNDLFNVKFNVPMEKFATLKKRLQDSNIYFKDTQTDENVQIECLLRKEEEFKMIKQFFKKIEKIEKKIMNIETTSFKFIQKYCSHLLKDNGTIKIKRDPKDPNNIIVAGISIRKKKSIDLELKKIKSVKMEISIIHEYLKEEFKKEAEKYFEQLTEFQIVHTIVTPDKSKSIIAFFAIIENQDNEKKVRSELAELLKGYIETTSATGVKDDLIQKVLSKPKMEKYKKDIIGVFIDYDAGKKMFSIKGIRSEDVNEVKSRIELDLSESKEKRARLTFNNSIEKNIALPLLRSMEKDKICIVDQGLTVTFIGSSQQLNKFIDNSYQQVMKEVRKKISVGFLKMSHDEFKFFSDKNIETKGKVVIEKNIDKLVQEVHQISNLFVYICKGDVFDKKWKAQVIVNSANDKLAHGGGLALQCSKICGEMFNRECNQIVKQQILKTCDVIPTNAGNLTFISKIYNAIPPVYNGSTHQQCCQLLETTVVNILKQAEQDGYTSLIIPPLSTGIFGFPLDQATSIITKTIHTQSPQLQFVKEIFLIGDTDSIRDSFSKSMNSLQTTLVHTQQENNTSIIEIEQDEYVGCFKYFDDIKKIYLPFTINDNRKLCEQYEKDASSTFTLLAEQGKKYKIDFQKMEQVEATTQFKRKIIYVPTLDSDYMSALWFWQGDAVYKTSLWFWKVEDKMKMMIPFRENQMKEIERKFEEKKTECEVFMTNEKYKSEDIKYYVKFDHVNGNHTQINSKTLFPRIVKRAPVQKIVKCKSDNIENIEKGSILYVYESDDRYYTFVSGSFHLRIPIEHTSPVEIVKTRTRSKQVKTKEPVYSFRLYGEKSDILLFKSRFNQLVKENCITESLSRSCNQFVVRHVLSEHPSMKAKVDNEILKINTSSSPFTITGFRYTVEKFKEYALLTIADKPELLGMYVYPQDWIPQTSNFILIKISNVSKEWKDIDTRIKKTIPNALVQKIEKIQNQLIYQSYKTEQDRINKIKSDSNGQYSTESQLLFHGTRGNQPSIIYEGHEGFDMRFSNVGMWGIGCYFAVNASYSHGYAYQIPNTTSRQFFLAEVLTGDSIDYKTTSDNTLRIPPNKPSSNIRYDSVQGYTGGSDVFIVYKNSQAYPKYLITYTTQ